MDRKQDASKDLLSEVTILIENNKILELRELLEEYHIISILEESDVEFFSNILSKLDTEHKKIY